MNCTEGHKVKVPWYYYILLLIPIMGVIPFVLGVEALHAKCCDGIVLVFS